jgi:ABC-type transport system substrate-binding protein
MRNLSKKGLWLVALLSMVLALALTACNRGENGGDTPGPGPGNDPTVTPTAAPNITPPPQLQEGEHIGAEDALAGLRALEAQFPSTSRDQAAPIARTGDLVIRRARAQTSGFPGIFHTHLSGDAADSWIHGMISYSLVASDSNRMFVKGDDPNFYAPVIIDWDRFARVVTFTWRPGVQIFWHDGVEMTLADLKYSYYFISHPEYQGVRFTGANGTRNVVGALDFNAGRADHIAGITLSADGRTMTVTYIEDGFPPSALFGGILAEPIPRHHFEGNTTWDGSVPFIGGGIPVGATREHENSRANVLGFGPFIIDTVVPGERVYLRANDNYWRGAPLVDGMLMEIIPPELQAELMRAGEFDVGGIRAQDYPDYHTDTNIQILGAITNSENFYYFTLGAQRQVPMPLNPPEFLTDDDGNYVYVPRAGYTQEGMMSNEVGEWFWVVDPTNNYMPISIYTDENGNFIDGPNNTVRAQKHTTHSELFFVARTDNHPITDVRFRRAIGYAMDHDTLNFTIRNGFQRSQTTVLHPFNTGQYINPDQRGTAGFHPDTANALLDQIWAERGWPAWTPGGTGLNAFRQVPNPAATGQNMAFTLNFGFRPSGQTHHIIFAHYQSNMAQIGIMLTIYAGGGQQGFILHNALVDRNIFGYELSPNDSMHMWNMSWSMGWNPHPGGLWGNREPFNLGNINNPVFEQIFDDLKSDDAWDPDFIAAAYRRWDEAFERYYPAVYDSWPMGFTMINNRLVGMTVLPGLFFAAENNSGWHRIGLTATERYVHQGW